MSTIHTVQFGALYKTTSFPKAEAKAEQEDGLILPVEDQWLVGTDTDKVSLTFVKESLANMPKVDPTAQKTMLGMVGLRLRKLLREAESLD